MERDLERELRSETRFSKLNRAVLVSLNIAGVLAIAAMAPNVASILAKTLTRSDRGNIKSAVRRLQERGLVQYGPNGVRLTPKGIHYLDTRVENAGKKLIGRSWDGKWRVVIFDIAEKRGTLRRHLRETLKRIGFMRLQDSVWTYPHDCEDLIALLKTDYRIGREVLYMIVDKIEADKDLRKHFNLK